MAYLEDAAEELQRRIDLVMAGREEENTHEIALSGDVNELVEEIDGLEIVDDDDENSEDDFDGDDWLLLYVRTWINSVYLTFNFFDSKHVWKLGQVEAHDYQSIRYYTEGVFTSSGAYNLF